MITECSLYYQQAVYKLGKWLLIFSLSTESDEGLPLEP